MPDAGVKSDHLTLFHVHISISSSYPDPSAKYLNLEDAVYRVILYQSVLMQAGENCSKVVCFEYGDPVPVILIPGLFIFYLPDKLVQVHEYIGGINHAVAFGSI